MKNWLLILLVLGLANTACAENPSPIVGERDFSDDRASLDGDEPEEEIELPAVKYVGVKTSSGECSMYVSVAEFEEEDGSHHHEILMKPILTTSDGHTAGGGTGEFYNFRLSDNSYHGTDEVVDGASPSLTSLAFNKDIENPDPNNLDAYEDERSLVHLLRMDYGGVSASELEETLEAVVASETITADQLATLNTVFQFFSRLKHGDHYHGITCVRMTPQPEVEVTTFDLGGHDHDHDDGHDDGDGHGHEHHNE